ncbi:MAG: hypothetical protein K6T63_03910 [Alicyclobacillus herbarius]|uniref:hypothetical protein n=1 Tax=Alicyclobacillus herbarius TaxID=122960 RepID=UPI002355ECEC|nr:hypothetical protein [Alicyclobacillus herbarius]MCL6631756.1 hypothetical protein [Alicyclobacillus herbarius]
MKERTVLASFFSESDANQAADRIHNLGVKTTQVAQLHTGGFGDEGRPIPIAGKIQSLASLTLQADTSRDAAVLLAADPSASGMADTAEGPSVSGERNFLLTVVCPEEKVEEVVQIIKECNGYT